jgi:ATP-binding protein involved in chromosome partitioning
MSELLLSEVEAAIGEYIDPYLGSNLLEANAVKSLDISGQDVSVVIELPYPSEFLKDGIRQIIENSIDNIEGVGAIKVEVLWSVKAQQAQNNLEGLQGVKNIIAVASGKGGVGKSTTSVNLALSLQADGARVGILDADIYGPSIGMMLGVAEDTRPASKDNKFFVPIEAHGLQSMSMAYLVTDKTPMVWRGPMASGALIQLITQTAWDDLDYLIIDLPPGTGDIQLTLSQKVPLAGSVIVTTPQDIALLDAKKGIEMFRKVHVPVLGVIENMSMHICGNCGHEEHLFGEGGGDRIAKEYDTVLLGSLPLSKYVREQSDAGVPVVADDPDAQMAAMYRNAARMMAVQLATREQSAIPEFEISND